jgi:hypothetical protein
MINAHPNREGASRLVNDHGEFDGSNLLEIGSIEPPWSHYQGGFISCLSMNISKRTGII